MNELGLKSKKFQAKINSISLNYFCNYNFILRYAAVRPIFCLFFITIIVSCHSQNTKDTLNKSRPIDIPKNNCRVIHILTMLCDNDFQGIVPVSKTLGNGDDLRNNLYWGCGYGTGYFFKTSKEWKLLQVIPCDADSTILERNIFKHKDSNIYLISDAYRGRKIGTGLTTFLSSCAGSFIDSVKINNKNIYIGASANLLVFIGHNALMDLEEPQVSINPINCKKDVMVTACQSYGYFYNLLLGYNTNPVLLSSSNMSAEAYSAHDAIGAWVKNKNRKEIRLAAVNAYAKYQKISTSSAGTVFAQW